MKQKLLHCYIAISSLQETSSLTLINRNSSKEDTQFNNSKSGFTLVEIILYMALMSIFILTLTDIFTAILEVRTESEATSAVEQDGRFILARLAYDIPRSSAITVPPSLESTTNNLVMTISGSTYTYQLSGPDLTLTTGATINNLNSSESSISGLTFKKIGNTGGKETISIQFTITSKTQRPSGPETRTFTTTIGRR